VGVERLSDHQLLALYQTRAEDGVDAIAEIYRRYAKSLYWRFVRSGIADPDSAADEVMLRVMEKCSSYDPARGSFAQWISGIARNVAREERRRHGNYAELFDFADLSDAADSVLLEALDAALARVEPEHWEGLHLQRARDGLLVIGPGRPRTKSVERLRVLFNEAYAALTEGLQP
jgi:DNA-directed RNA polymerase specialized sigma24 family protein